jgi:hypothetical protein
MKICSSRTISLFLACAGALLGDAFHDYCGKCSDNGANALTAFGFESSAAVKVAGHGSPALVATPVRQEPQSNWTSLDAPCSKFDDLRKPLIGNIGVKIDAAEPWADGFRSALRFWNQVLAASFYEETNLNGCSIRIIDGGPGVVSRTVAARSQIIELANFGGKIAVSRTAAKDMTNAEIYASAVHELGHMLGLKHNASSRSVMYFFNLKGTEALDGEDTLELSKRQVLQPAIWEKSFLPIQEGPTKGAAKSDALSSGQRGNPIL